MGMKSFYPKGNWVKRKSRIKESVESLIKWVFEKTVNKSWQNRWENNSCLDKTEIVFRSPWKFSVSKGFTHLPKSMPQYFGCTKYENPL